MAADSEPVPLETLAGLPEFYHPAVAPDGDRVALYYDGTGRNELHLLDRATGDHRPVTDGEVPRDATWHLRWGADGERVLCHRDDDGDEQNDLVAVAPGSGRSPSVETLVAHDGQAQLRDVADGSILYASDHGGQLNCYRHDMATGTTTRVTDHDQPVFGGVFAPDGERVAYVANESDRLENRDVYLAVPGEDPRHLDLGTDGSETWAVDWFPDGDRLLVDDDSDDTSRIGIHDLTTGTTRWLTPDAATHPEKSVAVAPGGERVVGVRERRAATMPLVYDVASGEARELALPEGAAGLEGQRWSGARVFADDDTLLLGHSTAARRRTLYEYDLAADEARERLPPAYGDLDPSVFVDASYVTYGSDGTPKPFGDDDTGGAPDHYDIGGLLFDPRDGPSRPDDATDVPGIVYVHGGPHFQTSRRFNVYIQFLVSQGYAVFAPNYRGSTGRGREFRHAIHGDWGGAEQADIAAGGRWLMDRDWVDADRVGVMGGSFGGYSVFCQLTGYPALWAAGIAWVGITDLHRLYAEDMPHFKHSLRTQMGDPEDDRALWRERSPIEHADAVERPLAMYHGVNDPRCPVEQSRLFRDALVDRGLEAGTDFEYEEPQAEGHGSTDIDRKVRQFEFMADFLERRL
ncbi:S9 family peptidase [Haloglomus litoreum]|uniref:S9 family peptidase n=1 Tax=Haloglomus litoreum TaxID=3034026 RepID=UPI0023E8ED95|nr:prolyl oligopeptidase family serine peptidase [Haloglomus sp. DT116]